MSSIPDVREPVIEIMKLMEEEPDNFVYFFNNVAYRSPKKQKIIFEIIINSFPNFEVEKIKFNSKYKTKYGNLIENLTEDEKELLGESYILIKDYIQYKRDRNRERQNNENRSRLNEILKKTKK